MSRARELSKIANINTFAVDSTDSQVGIASTVPNATLDVGGDGVFTGIVTATSFSGSGANLTGLATTETVRADTLTVAGVSTLTGAVNVDATTDSTSTTTGALIVDGGAAIAKNVYIGAGLSVAGTLTYEDVTNVDSVGLITAKSGVNVSGGQLAVGVAYSVGAAGVATAAGFVGPLTGDVTGDVTGNADTATTATNQSGGSVTATTGSFSSNLTVGSGITMGSAGVATFSGTADIHLLDAVKLNVGDGNDLQIYHTGTRSEILNNVGDFIIQGAANQDLLLRDQTGASHFKGVYGAQTELYYGSGSKKFETTNDGTVTTGIATATSFHVGDGSATTDRVSIGDDNDLALYHNGSNSFVVDRGTGPLYIRGNNAVRIESYTNDAAGEAMVIANSDGAVEAYYDASKKWETTNNGTVTTGITTANGAAFDCTVGPLKEKVKITAGKLSDNTNIDIYDGMVHYFTTQETTTSTPTIRYRNSTNTALNHVMSIGDVITLTVITTAAAGGFSANWAIDGNNVTEEWVGGSAPTAGGSDGLDIYSLTIIKTADATFTVIANYVNATN